jgi:taurine dioxygenase
MSMSQETKRPTGRQSASRRSIEIHPLTPVIGAEIRGIDLGQEMDPPTVEAVRAAWYNHTIVLFRGQSLSEEDQVRFGEYFGALATVAKSWPGMVRHHPSVLFISNIRENGELIGTLPDGEVYFHSDNCFMPSPPAATMLYGMEIPSQGGNTVFANMYAAYDALPREMKMRLDRLKALNVYDLNGAPAIRMCEIPANALSHVHSVIRAHPITGRKALYVNRLMTYEIVGLPSAESSALLAWLFDFQEQRQFVYEHVWRPGDLILWDNRCTLHARTDFSAEERRLLRRITVLAEQAAQQVVEEGTVGSSVGRRRV